MRIALHDDRYFSAYGAQRVMVSLGAQLRDRGWDPIVVTGGTGPLTELAESSGLPVRIVPIRPELDVYDRGVLAASALSKARMLGSYLGYSRDLERAHDDLGTDLVFANSIRPLLYSLVSRVRRRPIIWFLQGGEQFGSLSYAAPFLARRIMTVSQGAQAAVPTPLRRYAARRAWVNSPGIDVDAHSTRHHGARERFALPADATLVLVAGQVEPRKGFDIAIEALARAVDRAPELHLVVAGGARSAAHRAFERTLHERVAQRNLPVTFLGWVDDMPALMSGVDFFVLSSRLERLGLVTLEAMASGLPVIVTRAGGSEETVIDDETGILVDADDPVDLADAMVRLARSPDLRARLAAAGAPHVRAHFTTTRFVDRFVADTTSHFPTLLADGGVSSS